MSDKAVADFKSAAADQRERIVSAGWRGKGPFLPPVELPVDAVTGEILPSRFAQECARKRAAEAALMQTAMDIAAKL